MRVILVESSHYKPLNPYFDKALEELSEAHGWTSKFVDEADFFPNELSVLSRLSAKLLGDYYRWRRRLFNRHIQEFALVFRPDVLLLVNGKMVAPAILRAVKRGTRARLVNYATDDPFNPLVTTRYFRESVPEFDIYATPKKALMQDLAAAGCRNAVKTLFVYKPELHFEERPATVAEKRRF